MFLDKNFAIRKKRHSQPLRMSYFVCFCKSAMLLNCQNSGNRRHYFFFSTVFFFFHGFNTEIQMIKSVIVIVIWTMAAYCLTVWLWIKSGLFKAAMLPASSIAMLTVINWSTIKIPMNVWMMKSAHFTAIHLCLKKPQFVKIPYINPISNVPTAPIYIVADDHGMPIERKRFFICSRVHSKLQRHWAHNSAKKQRRQ